MRRCKLLRPGLVEYGKAWDIQREIFSARSNDKTDDTLIILQHPPTYTFGRTSKAEQPLLKENDPNAAVYFTDRGGGATYHGPGQIVVYPIIGIKSYTSDYHTYLRMLEDVMIKTLADFRINSQRKKGFTGVWVDEKKIGCIGVRIIRDFTMHGFSLNVNNDLAPFDNIIPCDIKGVKMISMKEILGTEIPGSELNISAVEERLLTNFSEVFEVILEGLRKSTEIKQKKDYSNCCNPLNFIGSGGRI